MSFSSINYTRIVCKKCGEVTTIEPGRVFRHLNCKCNTEISTPFQEITIWTKGDDEIELIGEFANGDYEIKYVDGSLSYRIPIGAFYAEYTQVKEEEEPHTLDELREKAKSLGIKRVNNMKRETLIKKIRDAE